MLVRSKRLREMARRDQEDDDDLEVVDEITQHYLDILTQVFNEAFLEPKAGEYIATANYPELDVVQGEVLYSFGGFLTPSISNDALFSKAFVLLSSSKPEVVVKKRLHCLHRSYSVEVSDFAITYSQNHSVRATAVELKRRFGVVVNDRRIRGWRRMTPRKQELS